MRGTQMKTRLGFAVILFLLLLEAGARVRPWGIPTRSSSQVLPMPGYYSDAIRRRGVEFYASMTHDTNGQPVFQAVRVNPDNSQEVFPGEITSIHGNKIVGTIPGRGTFRLRLYRGGTIAKGSLHLRRVNPADIAVTGRLRMEGWSVDPDSVTLSYGLVVEMLTLDSGASWLEPGVRSRFNAFPEFPPLEISESAP